MEGKKPVPIDGYSWSITGDVVKIGNIGDANKDFSAHWNVIQGENGNGFASAQLLQDYLTQVFTIVETDFLAYYILNRDN